MEKIEQLKNLCQGFGINIKGNTATKESFNFGNKTIKTKSGYICPSASLDRETKKIKNEIESICFVFADFMLSKNESKLMKTEIKKMLDGKYKSLTEEEAPNFNYYKHIKRLEKILI